MWFIMNNVIEVTNSKLKEIIETLNSSKDKYQTQYNDVTKEINEKLKSVKHYKDEYYKAKEKINTLNQDIEDFKTEYDNLVKKFKDDELSNILVSANKEISSKINDRKLKIQKDTNEMNKLVSEAELIKNDLVKLNAKKKALELLLNKAMDISNYYERLLTDVIEYSEENPDDLCSYFKEKKNKKKETSDKIKQEEKAKEKITAEVFNFDSIKDIVNE